jgi:hypothetical protein
MSLYDLENLDILLKKTLWEKYEENSNMLLKLL